MNNPNPSTGPKPPENRRVAGPPRDYLHDPLQLGLTIVGTTVLLGLCGWWLDKKFHTFPLLMVIGAVLGMFGIIYSTVKRLKQDEGRKSGSEIHGE